MMKTNLLEFQNQHKLHNLISTGEYDFPVLKPVYEIPNRQHYAWVGFNEVLSHKTPSTQMVHFYLHDYQFERVWNSLDKYTKILKCHPLVCTPDFSMFTDTPKAVQLYQAYRQRAVGVYWQQHGLNVIPTVNWSTPDSFKWTFDGLPTNSIISLSTLGSLGNKQTEQAFRVGYEEMKARLNPKEILCYGKIPDWLKEEVTPIGNQVEKFNSFNKIKGVSDEEYYKEMEV